jgi:hypothetical protein
MEHPIAQILEYVPGVTLEEYLEKVRSYSKALSGPKVLPVPTILEVISTLWDVLEASTELENAGINHGGLTTKDVMVTHAGDNYVFGSQDPLVKIIGFDRATIDGKTLLGSDGQTNYPVLGADGQRVYPEHHGPLRQEWLDYIFAEGVLSLGDVAVFSLESAKRRLGDDTTLYDDIENVYRAVNHILTEQEKTDMSADFALLRELLRKWSVIVAAAKSSIL